jgi:hypothetical protein
VAKGFVSDVRVNVLPRRLVGEYTGVHWKGVNLSVVSVQVIGEEETGAGERNTWTGSTGCSTRKRKMFERSYGNVSKFKMRHVIF